METPFDVWSRGEGWVAGTTVTITVDDGGLMMTEYIVATTVEQWGPNPWEVGFNFHTGPFEIQPGFVITVDDGTTVKVLVVADLSVAFDESNLTVSDTAPAGSRVNVGFGPAWRDVTADPADGSWEARLGVAPALGESGDGTLAVFGGNVGGSAQVFDDDGDSSRRRHSSTHPLTPSGILATCAGKVTWPASPTDTDGFCLPPHWGRVAIQLSWQ